MALRPGREAAARLLVPLLFAAILIGGVAALLVTRELRRGDDVVSAVKVTHRFSPAGQDSEVARIRFALTEADEAVLVEVIDADQTAARTLVEQRALSAGRHEFEWDGRTDSGVVAPEGRYQIRIVLSELGREVVPPDPIRIKAPGET